MKTSASRAGLTRRQAVTRSGLAAASVFALSESSDPAAPTSPPAVVTPSGRRDDLSRVIARTPFVDTHEHLVEEASRTGWTKPVPLLPCADWALLFSHYLNSDLRVAGMSAKDHDRFLAPDTSTDDKWRLFEPHWPAVKHTGYARAVRIAIERLHGIADLDARSVHRLAEKHQALVRPGYYYRVLRDHAGLESAQVNSLQAPFMESRQPDLLLQDLSILHFGGYSGSNWNTMTDASGSKATDLAGWHRVIDGYFEKYGPYAVAVKTQTAYSRRLDFADSAPEQAAPVFAKLVAGDPITREERKTFDDHVFWYCVRKATERGLPVKLHTGYYAGQNGMPLERVSANPGDVAEVLRRSPDTTFVLMHIGYPYHEPMLALAKHYGNAVIDMCWAWIINPEACVRFLRDYLVCAPWNKIHTFGGDYFSVENVVGHAAIARKGIAQALSDLVENGWMSSAEALRLVPEIMHRNAERNFLIAEKGMLASLDGQTGAP